MATQEILVNYKADVEQLTQQLNKVASAQDKVSDSASQTSKDVKQATITQEQAAKKRLELLKKEEAELKRLQAARKLAYDPKVIADFDRKIAASQQKIALLGKQSSQALAGVGTQIKSIGSSIALGIGAAFSVDAIINFSKASVNAFLEAEESANKLRFAVMGIVGESEVAFNKLFDQSQQLRDEFKLFSDEDIQAAQTQLATFGLMSNQIERLIPRILEFATVQRVDAKTATEAFIRGLEGQTRALVTAGLKFKDTGTIMGNYNVILEATEKLTGATAAASETLAGHLKAEEIQANELQETLGSKLAPVLVSLKIAFFEATLGLLGFNKAADDLRKDNFQAVANDFQKAAEKIKKAGGSVEEEFTKRAESITKANATVVKNIEELQKKLDDALKNRDAGTPITFITEPFEKQIELNREIIRQNDFKLKQIAQILDAEKLAQKQAEATLTAEELRIKTLQELNKLLEENSLKQDVISKDNTALIEKELAARKKAAEEADKRIAGSEEEIKIIKALGAEYAALFKLFKDEDKTKLIELSVIAVTDPDEFKAQVAKLAVAVSNDVTIPITIEPRLDITEFNDGINAVEANTVASFLENNAEIISGTQELLSSLLGLYQQYNDQKIAAIDKETDATLQALDEQESAVDKNLKNRRISEREAQKEKEQIERERIKVEEEAQRKIRAIKRREFNLNKIAALSEIAIETAKKVTEAPIPLKPYYAGFGLAQAAIVTAQPNPYRKGSKDTGSKEHLALVGEEGPELMMMQPHSKILPAAQTKTYGEAIEAMRKKQFDAYISEKYITPALIAQQKQHEKTKSKSFADNLSSSIINNYTSPSGRSDFLLEKISKGIPVSNISEIADALKSNRSYKR